MRISHGADSRNHNAGIIAQCPECVPQRRFVNRLRRFVSIEARISDSAHNPGAAEKQEPFPVGMPSLGNSIGNDHEQLGN